MKLFHWPIYMVGQFSVNICIIGYPSQVADLLYPRWMWVGVDFYVVINFSTFSINPSLGIQFLCDVMLCFVWVVWHIWKGHGAFIFRVKGSKKRTGLGLPDLKDVGPRTLNKIRNLPRHTLSHPRIWIFNNTALRTFNLCRFILLVTCSCPLCIKMTHVATVVTHSAQYEIFW